MIWNKEKQQILMFLGLNQQIFSIFPLFIAFICILVALSADVDVMQLVNKPKVRFKWSQVICLIVDWRNNKSAFFVLDCFRSKKN